MTEYEEGPETEKEGAVGRERKGLGKCMEEQKWFEDGDGRRCLYMTQCKPAVHMGGHSKAA